MMMSRKLEIVTVIALFFVCTHACTTQVQSDNMKPRQELLWCCHFAGGISSNVTYSFSVSGNVNIGFGELIYTGVNCGNGENAFDPSTTQPPISFTPEYSFTMDGGSVKGGYTLYNSGVNNWYAIFSTHCLDYLSGCSIDINQIDYIGF